MMSGLRFALLLAVLALFAGCPTPAPIADALADRSHDLPPERAADALPPLDATFLDGAERAALWIEAVAERAGGGTRWPEVEGIPAWTGKVARPVNLYGGNAGIALFLTRLAELTGKNVHREAARAAADGLVAAALAGSGGSSWKHEVELKDGSLLSYDHEGLYNGTAGVGQSLLELGRALGSASYSTHARGAGDWISAQAKRDSEGCSFLYGFTDLISGNAGTLLFLLELHAATGDQKYLATARCAGDWLIARAQKEGDAWSWPSMAGEAEVYSGFSHGVAGIAYALAALSERTGVASYLDAARAGGRWLAREALCDADGCRWHRSRPSGPKDYQTGWCHGVAGTARLFLLLERLTGDASYRVLLEKGAAWLAKVASPDASAPNYWGLSFCCGAASVGEFFLDLHARTKQPEHLALARKIGSYLLARGKPDRGGLAWTNYDQPDSDGRIWYATGLRLGAAGAGWFLLRLAAGGAPLAGLPDERI